MFTVAVLGVVEARRDDVLLLVPAGKSSELLARLALDAGRPLRAELLLDQLWPEPTRRNTLQSKVSQLRRALGPELVVGTGEGYLLALDPAYVDASQALTHAAASTTYRNAGDAASSLGSATKGLALFRGEVLVEAGDWAAPHRVRLEEVRMGLLEDALAARVDLGSGGDVVGELEALVVRHPLREGLWSSLVTALYRAGRQADALAAYSRVRRLLVEELGVDPGVELRSVEQHVLAHSPLLAGHDRDRVAFTPGNLPTPASPLVGRAADVEALTGLAAEQRLVTLVGTAGVGKTRLAVELANGLTAPGGVWLVRLDAVDPSMVLSAAGLAQVVAETLRVTGGSAALHERLLGAETVLVLDNCEHLVERAGVLARTLLDAVPTLRVLATSQSPLGVEDEHVYRLEPLAQDDSVALFAERAKRIRRQFALDASTSALVEEVCRSLDGLPLAIELAAARVRSLSMRDLVRHLDDRFALLSDPSSHRPARRRGLEAAISWSYDLLFPDDQRVLWALSCFAGGAALESTEHVAASLGVPPASVPDSVTRLLDRSLLAVDVGADGSVRYRLLDSIRTFAADRLRDAGLSLRAVAAHAGWYARTAAWCDAHVRGAEQASCLAVVRAERENVDLALGWCAVHDPELGVEIATGFGWAWAVLGDGTAGALRVRGVSTSSTPARARLSCLLLAGWLEASAGNLALAERDLDAAGVIAADLGSAEAVADVQRHLAFLRIQQGRPEEVLSCATTSLASYRDLGLRWQSATSLVLAAYGTLLLGDLGAATRDGTAAVGLLAELGDSWGLHAEALLAGIAQAEHRFEDAARSLERAADESQRLGFPGQAALHLTTLARVQQRAGDPAAPASFLAAIAAAAAVGDGRLGCTARLNLARLRRASGSHLEATSLLEQNLRWYDAAGGGDGVLLTRCLLYAEREDRESLSRLVATAAASGDDEVQLLALDALASCAGAQGDLGEVRELLARADALMPKVAHTLDAADRLDRVRALAALSAVAG